MLSALIIPYIPQNIYFFPHRNTTGATISSGLYVNPYLYYTSPPAPAGIASFGLYNYSGNVTPYVITTNEMLGYVNITSLLAYNREALRYGVDPYSATLQFNIVLSVNTSNGVYAYWLQDVGQFQTNKNSLTFIDNVWNLTGSLSTLSSSAITGNGQVASAGGGQTFYYDVGPSYTYSFPLSYIYIINMSYTSNAVYVWIGYEIIQIGQTEYGTVNYYDKITIYQPNIISASLMINGNNYTPNGLYYDAELVWGGGGNGAPTSFNSLNCTLGLYYISNGSITPVPSLYTFGADTAEAAYNVYTTMNNGVPIAYNGIENLTILTNNFSVILI
ncbi:thermopsin precursor [Sulfolobus acidocaldarius DSM 639]|nr:thermopsin precursor [Sulfolobus acidocaldarius DSM 639]